MPSTIDCLNRAPFPRQGRPPTGRALETYEVGPFAQGDLRALRRLNRLRPAGPCSELARLEKRFETEFGAQMRLAVYGTLAPGRSNHRQVADLEGQWVSGLSTRGNLLETGWGAELGYPALRWSMSGPHVAVELLVSPDLPRHWQRLDRFEGYGYRRILVPLFRSARVVEVANLYESSALPEASECQ